MLRSLEFGPHLAHRQAEKPRQNCTCRVSRSQSALPLVGPCFLGPNGSLGWQFLACRNQTDLCFSTKHRSPFGLRRDAFYRGHAFRTTEGRIGRMRSVPFLTCGLCLLSSRAVNAIIRDEADRPHAEIVGEEYVLPTAQKSPESFARSPRVSQM